MPVFKHVYVCIFSFPPSKVIISLQLADTDASETCKTSDFTGYKHFFVFKEKKNNERLYKYVPSYFCKPKVLQCF